MSASRALVITVSDRAARGVYTDRSGPLLVVGLRSIGLEVAGPVVVPDGDPVRLALEQAVSDGWDLVLTSGGTGLGVRDLTPEITTAMLDRPVPGIAELLRASAAAQGVPTAMLSRGVAGVVQRTLVVNVAGSPDAARHAVAVLGPLLGHALDQLRGHDHTPASGDPGDQMGRAGGQ